MHKVSVLAIAAVAIMATSYTAEAVPISFSTTGTFSAPTGGCTAAALNTLTCDGYLFTFSSTPTVQDVPFGFTSTVNFGQIAVTGAPNPAVVSGGGSFALTVNQTIPGPSGGSPFSYSALLTASLVNTASGSYLQFSAPFTRTVTGAYDVVYSLTEADGGIMGRSNISGLGQAALDINGTITPTAVPEPASLLLLGSGLIGLAKRARRRNS